MIRKSAFWPIFKEWFIPNIFALIRVIISTQSKESFSQVNCSIWHSNVPICNKSPLPEKLNKFWILFEPKEAETPRLCNVCTGQTPRLLLPLLSSLPIMTRSEEGRARTDIPASFSWFAKGKH